MTVYRLPRSRDLKKELSVLALKKADTKENGGVQLLIEVRLYATLRRHAPANAANGVFPVNLPKQSTAVDLLEIIAVAPDEVHLIMANGVNVDFEYVLREGDRIGLFPPVGGG